MNTPRTTRRSGLRRRIAWLVSPALALLIAACSSGGGTSATRTPPGTAASGSTSATAGSGGNLTVATNAAYPPIEFFASDGHTIQGLDPDLGAAIAKALNMTFKFVNVGSFSGIIPGIQSGRYPIAMSSITDRTDREKIVDFVDYLNVGLGILVAAGNPKHITTVDDLCGKTLAVETGSEAISIAKNVSAKCTKKGKPAITIKVFPSQAQAQLQLRTGRADANINDYPIVVDTARHSGGALTASPADFCQAPYGIAVQKNNSALVASLKKGLDAIIQSGEYKTILMKWGLQNSAISQAQVNGAATAKTADPICTAS